ncbi:hypothetical protein Ccrd_015780 [Cynara cardunculus var. scolymus]|uniref:Uncharacterized protein n=1 Tax=Cynara cardunculus var. scolymus TaxID=59895 RepID=A0A103YBA2_CYNCS|nr:hypothetical protein Ccrd_015780 [Cynara cardunculus var. scolymus]
MDGLGFLVKRTGGINGCQLGFVVGDHDDQRAPVIISELDAAALTIQKFYKSYRTRRNLADCAVVIEELWFVVDYLLRLSFNFMTMMN